MIDYALTYSKRKSIVIMIKDGNVCVKAPLNTNKARVEKFVSEKQDWILKKLAAFQTKRDRFSKMFSYEKFGFLGKAYDCVYSPNQSKITLEANVFAIPFKFKGDFKKVIKWYKSQAAEILKQRIDFLSQATGLICGEFALTDAKTKWGSCNADKEIRLNWRLIMLPFALIDYVIIHELCHTKHMNHSKLFWREVALYMPDFKNMKTMLKDCSVMNGLFR